jgi:hypothetical protein
MPNPHLREQPHHRHHHPHRSRLLDAITVLVDAGCIDSLQALISAAEKLRRIDEPDLAAFLRCNADGNLPLHFALEEGRLFLQTELIRTQSSTIRRYRDSRIAVLHPVPPHVLELFVGVERLSVLVPEGDHIPPHLRHLGLEIHQGFRQCQRQLRGTDVVVFEADADTPTGLVVHDAVADLLDPLIGSPGVALLVHLHPHLHRQLPHDHHPNPHDHRFHHPGHAAAAIMLPVERCSFI